MNCADCRTHLIDLVYGELDGERAAATRRHLEQCAACRAEHASLADTVETLDAWAPIESPDDACLIAAVAAARSAGTTRSRWRRLTPWITGLAAGLALFVGLLAANADLDYDHGRLVISMGRAAPAAAPALRPITEEELEQRLDEVVGLDGSFVLTAVDGRLQEWQAHQDTRYMTLVDALREVRAEDREHVAVLIDGIVRLVANRPLTPTPEHVP